MPQRLDPEPPNRRVGSLLSTQSGSDNEWGKNNIFDRTEAADAANSEGEIIKCQQSGHPKIIYDISECSLNETEHGIRVDYESAMLEDELSSVRLSNEDTDDLNVIDIRLKNNTNSVEVPIIYDFSDPELPEQITSHGLLESELLNATQTKNNNVVEEQGKFQREIEHIKIDILSQMEKPVCLTSTLDSKKKFKTAEIDETNPPLTQEFEPLLDKPPKKPPEIIISPLDNTEVTLANDDYKSSFRKADENSPIYNLAMQLPNDELPGEEILEYSSFYFNGNANIKRAQVSFPYIKNSRETSPTKLKDLILSHRCLLSKAAPLQLSETGGSFPQLLNTKSQTDKYKTSLNTHEEATFKNILRKKYSQDEIGLLSNANIELDKDHNNSLHITSSDIEKYDNFVTISKNMPSNIERRFYSMLFYILNECKPPEEVANFLRKSLEKLTVRHNDAVCYGGAYNLAYGTQIWVSPRKFDRVLHLRYSKTKLYAHRKFTSFFSPNQFLQTLKRTRRSRNRDFMTNFLD